ncbi:MAG: NUDIX hydrolase, partial [Candidatus Magasanikbacteria bacterium]|nr:NUDIX hydrolase [Candidatus Magasanikbacteria bacterium]
MRSISRDIVSAIIISKDNKIFLGRKDPSKGGVYKDCWHLPGGGIEKGETDEDALIREIQEETGI